MSPKRLGRYLLFEAFARGGMANVHYGRVTGPVGFSRIVAIKRHHEHLARETEFVSMLIDEARIAGRIRHPNVVPVVDVVQLPGELLLIMDYVAGISLAQAQRLSRERGELPPISIAAALVAGALEGLNAAHETRDDKGELAGIVHRDVSPQNLLCGADGVVRVIDFGIAHARERLQTTRTEEIKGKLEYMAKEQLRHERVDRRTDVYAASVILWELLTGARMFVDDTEKTLVRRVTAGDFQPPSSIVADVPPALDEIVLSGLAPEPGQRFSTALEMASALQQAVGLATQRELAEWMGTIAGDVLGRRAARVAEIEAWSPRANKDPSDETIVEAVVGMADELSDATAEPEATVATAPAAGADTRPLGTVATLRSADAPATVTEDIPTEKLARVRSVYRPAQTTAAAEGRWLWALPVGAALVGGALVVLSLTTRTTFVPEASAPRVTSDVLVPSPTPTASAARAPEPLAATPPPSSPAEPSAAPAPSVPRSQPTPRPPKRPPPNCTPPYSVDAEGVRVPKPECFAK